MSSEQQAEKIKPAKPQVEESYGFPVSNKLSLVEEKAQTRRNTCQMRNKCQKERTPSGFDPSVLPDDVLDQLWQVAERKNMTNLQSNIEEERFNRLEKETTARREIASKQE